MLWAGGSIVDSEPEKLLGFGSKTRSDLFGIKTEEFCKFVLKIVKLGLITYRTYRRCYPSPLMLHLPGKKYPYRDEVRYS